VAIQEVTHIIKGAFRHSSLLMCLPECGRHSFTLQPIISAVNSSHPTYKTHQCSFQPGRLDPYLRLSTVTIFVRDQDRSLKFYVDQLGFDLVEDVRSPAGKKLLTVAPPDGTAMLALVSPAPDSEEYGLIGRATEVIFLTEDVPAKFEEWRQRGVRFHQPPQTCPGGTTTASFEDMDGNSFTLLGYDEITWEVEEQRRLHAERLESERRTTHELEVARQVQARLFPQTKPAVSTLEYAGLCIQAHHVGGDYYDFLDLGRERLGLVIGDISGKGTAAALLMASLQAHFHNQCVTYWSRPFTPFALEQPERFLRSVNQLFYENTADGAYATLFFAEYDDKLRRVRYANCGHLSGILQRNDGSLERLDSTSTVMGLFKEWTCPAREVQLFPRDTLVLYTDGATEAFNKAGEEFGEWRLVESLIRNRQKCPQDLLAAMIAEVRQFSADQQHDDITLVVCKGRD
jgi:serine phosphatase RsbU (regulator of sigma subunit)/predicted enzyme related to lactoylglutathione lyase